MFPADMANIVRYLDEPSSDAQEAEKKKAVLAHLRSLGPMPCGGSRVERWVMAKAIKLGIQVQVTLGTTEGGFVMANKPVSFALLYLLFWRKKLMFAIVVPSRRRLG
jgi:hypothetical protein